MYPRKYQQRKKDYAASPSWCGQPISPDGALFIQRALEERRKGKENYNLPNKIKHLEEEKLQLQEKWTQIEAQNRHLEERQQRQPDINIINEGWGIMFGCCCQPA